MQYDYVVKHSFSLVEYDPKTHEQLNSRNFERGDVVTGDDARAIEQDHKLMKHVRRITPGRIKLAPVSPPASVSPTLSGAPASPVPISPTPEKS
jgi:hypothetical protein